MQKKLLYIISSFLVLSFFIFSSCHFSTENDLKQDSLITPFLNDPAIKAITEEIRSSPKNATLYAKRAQLFFDMRKVIPAISDIEKAIKLDEKNIDYYFFKTDVCIYDGYAQGAIDALQKVIDMRPDNVDAITKLSKVYLYKADFDNSMSQVNRLLQIDKNNFEPYFIMGLIYKQTGDTTKAISSFLQSLQHKDNFYDAYMQLGLLSSKFNNNDAEQYFNNAIRIDSLQAETYYAKAKYFQDKKNYNQAKKVYNQLIAKSPQNENAFFNLGFIYLLEDSIDKAYMNFDFAIKVKPQYANAYYYRALCESEKGNIEAAKSDLAQCLTLDPENELAQSLNNSLNKK